MRPSAAAAFRSAMPTRTTSTRNKTKSVRPPHAPQPVIGDAAVRTATGRTWKQWFTALDEAGCATRKHATIVSVVARHCTSARWSEIVTVGYERARELRVKR